MWAGILAIPALAQSPWEISAGCMAANNPVYYGASERRTEVVPLLALKYRGAYLGPSRLGSHGALGYSTDPQKPWMWMAEFGITNGRFERWAHHLLGMGDRIENYWLGAGVQRNFGSTFLLLATNAGLREDSGIKATLTLGHRIRFHGGMLESRASVTGATRQNMHYDFGISPEAAERRAILVASGNRDLDASDLGSYAPRGGLRDGSIAAMFIRPVNAHWSWVAGVRGVYLLNQASDSPLVRARSSVSLLTGTSYTF